MQRTAGTSHEVDDGVEGVGAVQRRGGAPDDLDALHRAQIDGRFRAEVGGVGDVVVEPVTIHQEKDSGVIVAGEGEAADSDVGVVAIVTREEPRDRVQGLAEGAVPVSLDLIAADDADRGGCLAWILLELRGGSDARDFLEQRRVTDSPLGGIGLLSRLQPGGVRELP